MVRQPLLCPFASRTNPSDAPYKSQSSKPLTPSQQPIEHQIKSSAITIHPELPTPHPDLPPKPPALNEGFP